MVKEIKLSCKKDQMYLVIYNIQSKSNVKALINTAFAFGCSQVWLVGQSKDDKKSMFISRQFQEALNHKQISLIVFSKWNDVLEHLEKYPEIALVGVEIDVKSQILNDRDAKPPFLSDHQEIAILMGNEGQGIHPRHLEACQGRLIQIPQYGTGTASFNVNVACSIVLYHFHQWKYRSMIEGKEVPSR